MWKYLKCKPIFTIKIRFLIVLFIFSIFILLDGGKVYYRIFYVLFSAFVLSIVILILNRFSVKAKVDLHHSKCYAGDKISYDIILNNDSILPAAFVWVMSSAWEISTHGIRSEVLALGPAAVKRLTYDLELKQRGVYNLGEVELKISDAALIASITKKIHGNAAIYVYPKIYKLKVNELQVLSSIDNLKLNASGAEYPYMVRENRKYAAGDSLKKINWKVSAKNNELYVKNEDRVLGNDFNVFIDMNENNYQHSAEDEERMISTCVSIVNQFYKQGVVTKLTINNYENTNFQVKDNKDFSKVMDYFLYNKSKSKMNFLTFLKINLTEEGHIYNTTIITNLLSKELLEYIKKLSSKRKKNIVIFYNYIYDSDLESNSKYRLGNYGIELIKMQHIIK